VKTTMMFRNIANPRRTKLADLKDLRAWEEPRPAAEEQPEHAVELPVRTANPRRTTLMDVPE
jgi:hypothetical protein